MRLSRPQTRALTAFRRTHYAAVLKEILDGQLQEGRHAFESTMADEGKRAFVLAVRAIEDILFTNKIEVEDDNVQRN